MVDNIARGIAAQAILLLDKGELKSGEKIATENYIDNQIGNIENTLDEIISIQNSLINGANI